MMNFYKQIVLCIVFMLVVTACGNGTTPAPQVAPAITSLPTVASTTPILPTSAIEPSSTPDPNAPKEFTRYENGTYYLDTSEKGVDYHYTWDSKEKLWLRPLGTFPLIDLTAKNYLSYKILISSSAQGGQDLVSLSHTDSTSDNDLPPVTAEAIAALQARVKEPNMAQLQMDMLGMNGGSVYLSLITSTGEKVSVKLNDMTSIITEVVGFSDLEQLMGKGVTQWTDLDGLTYLSIVTGVDAEGIHGKIAFKGDIRTLTDFQKRNMIFSIGGNILTREDQQIMSETTWTSVFATNSVKTRPDGTQDVGIVYNP